MRIHHGSNLESVPEYADDKTFHFASYVAYYQVDATTEITCIAVTVIYSSDKVQPDHFAFRIQLLPQEWLYLQLKRPYSWRIPAF